MLPDKPFVPLARIPFQLDADGKSMVKPFKALDYLKPDDNVSQYFVAPMYMSGNPANDGPHDRHEFPYLPLTTYDDVEFVFFPILIKNNEK
ncbi:MAG: hypothetical protein GY714_00025 [Desulfobacterales bacterium]|nr:hypothetical protein [Desulfobacterales bacterium]